MINNLLVKNFLSRLTEGIFLTRKNVVYPTVDLADATVVTKTADYTVLKTDMGKIFNNTADDGTQVLTLPALKDVQGECLRVAATAAQIIRLLPQTGEAINLNGSAVASKYLNIAGVIGNYVDVYADNTEWVVVGYSGVVTKEA